MEQIISFLLNYVKAHGDTIETKLAHRHLEGLQNKSAEPVKPEPKTEPEPPKALEVTKVEPLEVKPTTGFSFGKK